LESAVALPATACFGVEVYPTVFDKAAAYLFYISRNHAFIDGNKRTATAAMLAFLRVNGESTRYDAAALTEFVVGVASGDIPWEARKQNGWLLLLLKMEDGLTGPIGGGRG